MKVENRRFPDFLNLISTQIYSLKTVFSTFLPKKKVPVASHFSQPEYRRFGPKRASYIRIIAAFESYKGIIGNMGTPRAAKDICLESAMQLFS